MKFIILLLHSFITQAIPFKLCFQQPCSADDEEVDNYKYEEALEYCAKKGPTEMPFYGNQSQFYGICDTVGGPNPGKPCIFPFIWEDETFNGKLNKEGTLKIKSKELFGKDGEIRNANWPFFTNSSGTFGICWVKMLKVICAISTLATKSP